MLTTLGTPPAGFVVPWSEASIGGYALDRMLSQVQLTRVEARASTPTRWLIGTKILLVESCPQG